MASSVQTAQTSNQQAWIFEQFNGTTYVPNSMDVQHEPLYDENTYAAGTTIANQSQYFTSPAGKTLAQTNVTTAKKLDAPQAMTVMGINWKVRENILLADFITIMDGAVGFCSEFWIGEKSYNRAPLWYYCNGGGVTGIDIASGASALTNGRTGKNDRHTLAINIVIDNQASFYGQLTGTAVALTAASGGGTGAALMMLLEGLHARGVQ
jgi:hypothetical protein